MATNFLDALSRFGERIETLDDTLLGIAGRLVQEMKTDAPVDQGDLRNSIQATVENNSISFQMLYYGFFQNYGVAGTEGDSRFGVVNEVPSGILPPPRQSSKYQYRDRKFGIPAQDFFDFDYMGTLIQNEIANRLEL